MEPDKLVTVVDHGSDTIKAGIGNYPEKGPQLIIPSLVTPLDDGAALDVTEPDPEKMLHPFRHGMVQDWEMVESIYNYTLYEQLGWKPGEGGWLFLSEPALTPKKDKEHFAQMMFETFGVTGLFTSEQPVLSLYGCGRVSGLCVDLGAEKTDVCPVHDGAVVYPGLRRQEHGGADLDRLIQRRLAERGVAVSLRDARGIKERCAQTLHGGLQGPSGEPPVTHELPDGRTIEVGDERFEAGEALFDPGRFLGADSAGVQEQAVCSVAACLPELRRSMYDSILVCGGGSSIKGLPARVALEMDALSALSFRLEPTPAPEYMPENALHYAAWYGAAIASKAVFQSSMQYMSKNHYHELGPSGVYRKGL